MKVKALLKKFNAQVMRGDVYLMNSKTLEKRKATSWDFGDYYAEENDKTVVQIELIDGDVTVYYK